MAQRSVAEEAISFMRTIHGDREAFAHIQTIDLNGLTSDHKFFKWPSLANEMGQFVEQATLEGKEVYTSPVLFLDESSHDKTNIASSRVVWVEFDGNARRQNKNVPEPTLRILSGRPNGEHWYWVLENELRDVKEIESINRGLSSELDADPTCWEASRVLRIPGTVNHKYDIPRRVEVFKTSKRVFDVSAFDDFTVSAGQEIAVIEQANLISRMSLVKNKKWTDDELWEFFLSKEIDPHVAPVKMLELAEWAARTGEWSDGEIFSALAAVNDTCKVFDGYANPGYEIAKIVARAREKNPVVFFDEGAMDMYSSDEDIRGYTLLEIAALEIVIKWVVEGLIMEASNLVIAAPGGTGKSQLMFRMGLAIASGSDFLQWKIKSGPQKVIYLALEFGMAQTKTMMNDMNLNMETLSREYDGNFIFVPRGFGIKLNTKLGQDDFLKIIRQHSPDIVIIDSIKGIVEGQITQDGPVGEVFEFLGWVQKKYGTIFCIIHHTRKGNFQNPTPTSGDDLMGSAYITNNASTTMLLVKMDPAMADSPLKLTFPKTRNMADGEIMYLKRTEDLNFLQITEDEALEMIGKKKKSSEKKETNALSSSEMGMLLSAIESMDSKLGPSKDK